MTQESVTIWYELQLEHLFILIGHVSMELLEISANNLMNLMVGGKFQFGPTICVQLQKTGVNSTSIISTTSEHMIKWIILLDSVYHHLLFALVWKIFIEQWWSY